MATIYIDNKPYQVKDGQNLLHACLSLGFDIPYFCWHPAMHSVGSCRQCAVKQFRDEKDTRGKIVMSCMTPAADGTRISIDDPEAKAFRASVIEWLMTNHPHDCPVCDEGGECHLQDMTVMTGHDYRRFRFRKRTYQNQYLGPFINHEMNRCIQCYRCVRFYRGYAGGRDLEVFASHNHVYFGRHQDGVLENEFSGNLVEVCPTGVFTDKTLKTHYTRKWDLQTAPSVCVHCGLGCNTIAGERYGLLRRILNRYHGEVNGYFLCDRGRFGYGFVNSDLRIRQPLLRDPGNMGSAKPVTKEAALRHLASLLSFGGEVIGIGSPRASLEANFALRTLVGPDRFYAGLSEKDSLLIGEILTILAKGPARSASQSDAKRADAVLILGEDVTNTAPMLALALRQCALNKPVEAAGKLQIPEWHDAAVRTVAQNERGPLFIATTDATKLDDIAAETYRAAPDDVARLGFAIAAALSDGAPTVPDLSEEICGQAGRIAEALRNAKRPLIVSGTGCGSIEVIHAAANVARALCKEGRPCEAAFVVPECNSLGLALMEGRGMAEVFRVAEERTIDTAVVLENDLFRRAGSDALKDFFNRVKHVIVVDHIESRTTAEAEAVIPSATFAEAEGTLVSSEGRAQRFFRVLAPADNIQESWRWLREIGMAAGHTDMQGWRNLDTVTGAMAKEMEVFRNIPGVSPPVEFRISGMKVPRQPHRYSGRTAMQAKVHLHEPKPPDDPDSPLSFSMEGYDGMPPASLVPRYWAPGWNSVQATSKYQKEVGGALLGGDPGLRLMEAGGHEAIPFFSDVPGPFAQREGVWLVVPRYQIFGSEELSALSPAVAERMSKPFLVLNPDDAFGLGMKEGSIAELSLAEKSFPFPIVLRASIPRGVAGIVAGLPGTEWINLPMWGKMVKKEGK
jgi:NADH-quinone oxidoreductase subunit G